MLKDVDAAIGKGAVAAGSAGLAFVPVMDAITMALNMAVAAGGLVLIYYRVKVARRDAKKGQSNVE